MQSFWYFQREGPRDSSVQEWPCLSYLLDVKQMPLLYSWCFSYYSASIHWQVHGHMVSNNETISLQMPRVDNIAKNYDVKWETAHCYPHDVDRCGTSFVNKKGSFVFHWFDPFLLLYNKSLNDWSLGE